MMGVHPWVAVRVRGVVALLAVSCVAVACAPDAEVAEVIRVPADAPTIAAAVERADVGDVVLVAPGTYHESVRVETPGITIRGEDRNSVVLDGEHSLANGFVVAADDVAIENLTTHSFTNNGVIFSGIEAATGGRGAEPGVVYGTGDAVLRGFRVSYVTSYNNGLYGIYAFASRDGVIEESYVSGHPDSGIYVGQCNPCNTVIRRVTAELNAIGYYGTNASGGVYVIDSVFRRNRLGVAPNSQRAEQLAPQEETVVAGNLVVDNADPAAPEIMQGFAGGGIAIGGGTKNTVLRNRVEGNAVVGIAVVSLNDFLPLNNRVEENVLADNGIDLFYGPSGTSSAEGNCFSDNVFVSSSPAEIDRVMACDVTGSLSSFDVFESPESPDGPDYRDVPPPPQQPSMPAAAMAARGGAGSLALDVDLSAIRVPDQR